MKKGASLTEVYVFMHGMCKQFKVADSFTNI